MSFESTASQVARYKKQYRGNSRDDLICEQAGFVPTAPQWIAAQQLIDEMDSEVETRRHQEAISLDRQAISQSRIANRLALVAIGIAGAAFLVAILAWLFPREPQASGHKEPDSLPAKTVLKGQ
jgi:hypothetical protein